MNRSRRIFNPVQPCPWISTAPVTCRTSSKRPHQIVLPSHVNMADEILFKDLNKCVLRLVFPNLDPRIIEAALALSNCNLAETIHLLRVRLECENYHLPKRPTNNYNLQPPQQLHCHPEYDGQFSIPMDCQPDAIRYVPTKYSDVQIVETVMSDDNGIGKSDIDETITLYKSSERHVVDVAGGCEDILVRYPLASVNVPLSSFGDETYHNHSNVFT